MTFYESIKVDTIENNINPLAPSWFLHQNGCILCRQVALQ